ncbi:MAG: adenylate/guanylate cyclase domain-containing protein [Alphaproteobacteria bacterium]
MEEIITELSRFRNLFVIARNSSFAYKGRSVDAKRIGRELGVRYILEGSVRKSAGRVRIMGRLVDEASGTLLWADRFEAQLEVIFDLQDQVTESVIGAIGPKLEQAEIDRAKRKPTENLDAYDYFLRGLAAAHRWTRGANDEALQMFYKAIELDPDFASAYGMAARCYSQRKACGWVTDHAADNAEVERLARKASGLGMDDAVALSTAGIGLAFVAGDIDGGCIWIERALALNPNLAIAWLYSGWVNIWIGLPDIAIERLSHAIRLSPQDPEIAMMQGATACAHFFTGRIDDAIFWAEQSLRLQPNYLIATSMLAASYAIAGRSREAEDAVERVRRVDPNCRISKLLDSFPFRRKGDFNRWSEGLRKAGLPE